MMEQGGKKPDTSDRGAVLREVMKSKQTQVPNSYAEMLAALQGQRLTNPEYTELVDLIRKYVENFYKSLATKGIFVEKITEQKFSNFILNDFMETGWMPVESWLSTLLNTPSKEIAEQKSERLKKTEERILMWLGLAWAFANNSTLRVQKELEPTLEKFNEALKRGTAVVLKLSNKPNAALLKMNEAADMYFRLFFSTSSSPSLPVLKSNSNFTIKEWRGYLNSVKFWTDIREKAESVLRNKRNKKNQTTLELAQRIFDYSNSTLANLYQGKAKQVTYRDNPRDDDLDELSSS